MPASMPDNAPDAARILDRFTDAFFTLDREWRFSYLNAEAERVLARSRQALLGRGIWDEFPEAVGTASEVAYRRAMEEGTTDAFEQFYPPLETWFEARAYPSPEGVSVYFRDISGRKRAEDALRAVELRYQEAQSRLESALSAGGIATWTWDVRNDRLVADTRLAPLFSVSPADAAGGRLDAYLQAVHPDDRDRVAQAIGDAVARGDDYEVEYRVVLLDGTERALVARGKVTRDDEGRAIALDGVVVDITEAVSRRLRERFLAELAERARGLTDPDGVIADAVLSLGTFLGVSRCVFADIDIATDVCTITPHFRADESVLSMAGTFPISAFGPFLVGEYEAGRTVVVDDVRADHVRFPADYLDAYEAIACRAFVAAPVLHSARLVSVIAAHSDTPRHWKVEEVELLQTVVERTWLTVEVIRQQHALARETEASARIMESITDACYTLDSEWRFTYINRQAEVLWGRTREELLGRPLQDVFPQMVGSTSLTQHQRTEAERVPARFETLSPVLDRWVDVSIYPVAEGGLSVFFRDISERKAIEAERAALAERERNIASQLQEALQPDLPGTVPGLGLAKHYDAGLAEAGVGGDFWDVYAIERGCTALVVGDLSGKGLAAAAQVATVRNMLRAFMYSQPTVADALNSLNRVLAENNLLTGFTTLFVGAYESVTGRLRYVNCGQEPALLRRAAGSVEALPPTGPILGSIEDAVFAEQVVTLGPGDAVAIFTDGLTEVGRSRQTMLGIEGVTALLEAVAPSACADTARSVADYLARTLIAGVDAAARDGVLRDDVCLLVAVSE